MNSETLSKETRRIILMKKKLFGEIPKGVSIKRASNYDEVSEAFKLVHDVYLMKGYIHQSPTGLRIRKYDATPDMATYIATKEGKIISTHSYLADSPDLGIPTEETFPEEINNLRKKGKICEFANWSLQTCYQYTSVATELMRCCFAHAYKENCDFIVGEVSPNHRKFFEINLFDVIGEEQERPSKKDDKVIAVSLNLNELEQRAIQTDEERGEKATFLHDFWFKNNPYWDKVRDWEKEAKEGFSDPRLYNLLVESNGLEQKCSPEIMQAIRARWTPQLLEVSD